MEIKNIIFDLGGVLLNLNYQKTIDAFRNLGIEDFETLYSQAEQSDLFNDLEIGKITEKEFLFGISKYLPKNTENAEIISAWNAMLLDLPKERLDFLLEIKKKYNTALLSNTNEIHLEYFHRELEKKHQISSLDNHFHKVYFSCRMGMRKPYPEIFKKVCELENFIPEETLFIDDSIQHIEGAKSIGIQAKYLDVQSTNIIELIGSLLAEFN